jgi:hypothetical protein
MYSASWPRTAFSYLRNAVWSPTSACIVAVVVLANLLPTPDGQARFLNPHRSEACRTCAVSSASDRACLDAWLIAHDMMDPTTASKNL